MTELSGSESSAHFTFDDARLGFALAHGAHPYEVGEDHTFYMDAFGVFLLCPDGSRVA